jgi:hypothetical protein
MQYLKAYILTPIVIDYLCVIRTSTVTARLKCPQ